MILNWKSHAPPPRRVAGDPGLLIRSDAPVAQQGRSFLSRSKFRGDSHGTRPEPTLWARELRRSDLHDGQ
jgi:hypothetical protein